MQTVPGCVRRSGLLPPVRAAARERARRWRERRRGVGLLRFTSGNAIEAFADGYRGLRAMHSAIARARQRVDLESYILRDDETGLWILGALAERARAGVRVRVLYDAFGSFATSAHAFDALRAAGGEVVAFDPIARRLFGSRLRRSDHRKLLIVDGTVGFVGGLNIGDEYAAREPSGRPAWRDAHVRIAGPAVGELAAAFRESWARAGGSVSVRDERASIPPVGSVRCSVFRDGPIHRRRRMRDLIGSLLDEAETSALLVSPYFLPDRRVRRAMEAAAARGVRVALVTAGRSDHALLRRAARPMVEQMVARGIRVFEDRERMMHAKAIAIDGQRAMLGTTNIDRQSLRHSYEISLLVEDVAVAQWVERHFGPSADGSTELAQRSLAHRRPCERLLDLCAQWVARWI